MLVIAIGARSRRVSFAFEGMVMGHLVGDMIDLKSFTHLVDGLLYYYCFIGGCFYLLPHLGNLDILRSQSQRGLPHFHNSHHC